MELLSAIILFVVITILLALIVWLSIKLKVIYGKMLSLTKENDKLREDKMFWMETFELIGKETHSVQDLQHLMKAQIIVDSIKCMSFGNPTKSTSKGILEQLEVNNPS